MKCVLIAGIAAVIAVGAASAQELKAGWSVQYQQDSFSGLLTAGSFMTETGEGFGKAMLSYVCGVDSVPSFAFRPGGFSMASGIAVDFKLTDGVKKIAFAPADTLVGRQWVASVADTTALRDALERAAEPLPYRTDDAKGTFPAIGAKEAFKVVEASCQPG